MRHASKGESQIGRPPTAAPLATPHIPGKQIALRAGDWRILASADPTKFELYNIANDRKESADLKDKEPERFKELREQLLAHNTAVEAEGPDWWKRLTKDGAREVKQRNSDETRKRNMKQTDQFNHYSELR